MQEVAEARGSTSIGRPDWSTWPRYDAAGLGFRNYWYPVMYARQLRRSKSVKLLGERLVLMRDGGKVYALNDRCLHRGVPLSISANRFGGRGGVRQEFPGTVTCSYHGWTYDLKSGTLVAALTDGPESPICGKVRLKTYPVEERLGWLWVYMGEGEAPPVEYDIPHELLEAPHFSGERWTFREGNWRFPLENAIDEAHPRFLHRVAMWRYFKKAPPAWNLSKVEYIEDGTYVTYRPHEPHFKDEYPGLGVWPKNPWWMRGRSQVQLVAVRLPCIVRVNQPGFTIFSWYVPVDENHHIAIQTAAKFGSWVELWRFKLYYWLFYRWINQRMFGNQDYQMIRATDAPPERLFRPDLSIIAWRKLCERARGPVTATSAPAGDLKGEIKETELRELTKEYSAAI